MLTSNNAELINVMNVNPRDFPITWLLEFLRGRFQQWFYKRREAIAAMLIVVAKIPEDNLVCIYENSRGMEVIVLSLVP